MEEESGPRGQSWDLKDKVGREGRVQGEGRGGWISSARLGLSENLAPVFLFPPIHSERLSQASLERKSDQK